MPRAHAPHALGLLQLHAVRAEHEQRLRSNVLRQSLASQQVEHAQLSAQLGEYAAVAERIPSQRGQRKGKR